MDSPADKNQTGRYYRLGLKIMADFGVSIAVPVVVFVLLGRYLDRHYPLGGWPWYTLAGFVLAAVVTAKIIYRKARRYGRVYEEIDKQK